MSAYSTQTMTAGETLIRARLVTPSTAADFTALQADVGDVILGVTQLGSRVAPIPEVTADPPEAAQSGEQLDIIVFGQAYVEAGAAITRGARLKADSAGRAIAVVEGAGTQEETAGIAQESAGAAGEIIKIHMQPLPLTTPA